MTARRLLDLAATVRKGFRIASKNSQTSPYCSVGIILMCLGIAEIDKQTITEQLSDMPIIALNDLGTDLLVYTDHVTPVFWVELAGELRGVHQITEHDGELPSFSLWSLRRLLCLHS